MRAQRRFRLAVPAAALIVLLSGAGWLQAGPFTFALQSIDPPQASQVPAVGKSEASAVSNTGVVIGTYWTGTAPANAIAHGYELQNGTYTTFTAPGPAPTGNFSGTYGQGINSAGLALFINQTNSSTSYLYQPLLGTYLPLNDPGAAPFSTFANSINDAGIVTGVYFDGSNNGHGFQYNVATTNYVTLPDVPGAFTTTAAQATAPNGDFVANYDDAGGNFHGALYSNGSFTLLDFPGATQTFTDGINAFGQISGNFVDGNGTHGFVYAGGAWHSVDFSGAASTTLFYNNNAGQVAGDWVDPNGEFHSLLLTPTPEPTSLALFGLGGLALAGWRRWKGRKQATAGSDPSLTPRG